MSIPSLDSSRSTCLMACFVTRPRASARPCPIVLTARDAVLMTPSVALARDSTRLACRSPSNRFSRKRFTCGKSGVWSGFIGRPANRVTCGEIRGSRDSGNRKVTNERLRIRTGRPGFFMESHGGRLDSFITRRIQSKMRGCIRATTASQLFKRLNAYSWQHPLYQALKEFGKIPKTLFILKYCDDLQYRQAIERQLNKGEGSNKFSKAVSFGHSHEFIQGEKEDQEIAEACRRLIKNAIVCWNYLYLSQVLAKEKNEERRTVLIAAIRNGSVATWGRFNLHGGFDFSDERMV